MEQEGTTLTTFYFLNLAEGIRIEAVQFSPVFIVSNEEKILFYFTMILKEDQTITFYFATLDLKSKGKVTGTKNEIAHEFNGKVILYSTN